MARMSFSANILLIASIGLWGLVGCRQEKPQEVDAVAAAESAPPSQPPVETKPPTEAKPPTEKEASRPAQTKSPDTAAAENTLEPEQASSGRTQLMVAPDVNTAILDLVARWDNIRSVSATLQTTFKRTDGRYDRQETLGIRDCMKKDGRVLVRAAYKAGVVLEAEDNQLIATGQRVLRVFDGEFLYVDDERHEGRTVTKSRPVPGQLQAIGGRRLFAGLRGLSEIKLLPDKTIDDKSVYAFVGKAGGGTITMRHYFDKQTGILVKMTRDDELGHGRYTFALSDIKLNVDFEEGHFTYTPPEGIEVQDLTRPGTTRVPPPTGP